tara:strand:+ start:193 stop:930 length:738 start_codon:yes stop_codon:yes gene_type:complete
MDESPEESPELAKLRKKLAVSDRKVRILEEMVESRTRELFHRTQYLETRNQTLEEFSLILSHDLIAPLNTIGEYVNIILAQYGDALQGDGTESLRQVSNISSRLCHLTDQFLTYLRYGSRSQLEEIDCQQILDSVIASLGLNLPESQLEICVDPLPSLVGYASEFEHLVQNLVSNATKFRRKETEFELSIGAQRRPGDWLFSFRDNGLGISSKYHREIFVLFQRVHRDGEYPGTGVGLAYCKKIV